MTPGLTINPEVDEYEEDMDSMCLCVEAVMTSVGDIKGRPMDAVMASVGNMHVRPASYREGEFESAGCCIKMFNVLWDSGACHRSYISKDIVDKNRDKWKDNIVPFESTVRLADQVTTVRTTEIVRGNLSFVYDDGNEISAKVDAVVWEMSTMEFILGLPDILRNFLDLFVDMLRIARGEMLNAVLGGSEDLTDTDMLQGEERVWSDGNIIEIEEELESYTPVQFESVLDYMETSVEDSRKIYLDSIESHIGPYLSDCKELRKLLTSDLALERFAPSKWDGIKGVALLSLKTRDDLPEFHKTRTRMVNKSLLDNAYKEFLRLCEYMYDTESKSPYASPLCIAYKATAPGIRYCGDHRWLNPYLIMPQAYIPNVQHELEKAIGYRIMGDIDLSSAFHQFRMDKRSSELLAVQTIWGLVEPKFMPEGISVGPGHLQHNMMMMFQDYTEWMIVLFDNILLLAHDTDDFMRKMLLFLQRCEKHNIILKYAKTWLGFESVKFFGYKVSYGKYELDTDRKEAITACEMPVSVKGMQSFLGAALFFKNHVPDFSNKAHLLHKMTRKEFSWDRRTWKEDYENEFKKMKEALADSVAIHFPDYSLPWVLRVDASHFACGAVLYQIFTKADGSLEYQPIGFGSKKFSDGALKWDTMKKETFGAYWGVKHFEHFLRNKGFVLETDHRNILWLDKSDVPIIMRWRVYLQSFLITIRHISGAKNTVADWLSRMYPGLLDKAAYDKIKAHDSDISCVLFCLIGGVDFEDHSIVDVNQVIDPVFELEEGIREETEGVLGSWTPEDMFAKVHGGRNFHMGARRTWLEMNRVFPGHKVKYRKLAEMIMECPVCQKDRNEQTDKIEPSVRHIKPPHWRARVGVDNLKVTPADANGNEHLIVVVDQFSRHVWGMPAKTYEAKTIATALFVYFTLFGVFDELWSDPGSDLMSETVKQLNLYMGIKHVVSLVDRHQSNGVEGPNKQILRHLRTLVYDTRMIKRWTDPIILCMVFFVINDSVHSETGYRPLDLKFGSDDGPYMRLPEGNLPATITQEWLKDLDKDLTTLRAISRNHQSSIAAERVAATPLEIQNVYQPGDLVLLETDINLPRATKLTPFNLGPYEVITQVTNDVHCRHLATAVMKHLHVSQLKMFYGTSEDGMRMAMLDADRYFVKSILAWRGTVKERSCMQFYVEFADGEKSWLEWSRDLDNTQAYGDLIHREHPLYLLRFTAERGQRERSAINKHDITEVSPGDVIFIDLRRWDECWYDQLSLPDSYSRQHVIEAVYTAWDTTKTREPTHKRIKLRVNLFDENLIFDHYDVQCWGRTHQFVPNDMILVDLAYVTNYPAILSDDPTRQQQLLRRAVATPVDMTNSERRRGRKG